MSDQALWFVCNTATQFCSPEVTFEAAREILAKVPRAELENWNAWQNGWPEWKPVEQCPELLIVVPPPMPIAKPVTPPPLPAPVATRTAAPEPPKAAELSSERRRFPRFDVRLRVIIRNEELTFRTFSCNISLSGISLERPVPERIFGRGCQIFIAGPTGENLRFSIHATSRNDLHFFSFEALTPPLAEKLEAWLRGQPANLMRQAI